MYRKLVLLLCACCLLSVSALAEDWLVNDNQPQAMESVTEKLLQAGIDVERGSLYCNGTEKLIQVIQGCFLDYADSAANADALFEKKNWKEYTVAVHGIKGAMASIGAAKVSDLAKQLELAGKENRTEYIEEHHAKFQEEYASLFHTLKNCLTEPKDDAKEAEQTELLPVLSLEQLEALLEELEGAAYELEAEKMLHILAELQGHRYGDVSLSELFAPVKRKVEESDCISAAELAMRLKVKLAGKEE